MGALWSKANGHSEAPGLPQNIITAIDSLPENVYGHKETLHITSGPSWSSWKPSNTKTGIMP